MSSASDININLDVKIYVIYGVLILVIIGLIYVIINQSNKSELSSLITTGPIPDTVKIPATGGLYYYTPAICYLYAKTLTTDGWIQWDVYDTIHTPMRGFSLGDSYEQKTSICPSISDAYYEITINGAVAAASDISYIILTMDNINIRQYDLFRQSCTTGDTQYTVNSTAIAKGANFNFKIKNANLYGGLGLYDSIKFIGF
jgi:hypothetical protein